MDSRPRSIFVLMPFIDEFDDVYMVIKDAAREAEARMQVAIRCLRADEIAKPGRITDQIIQSIKDADLLIADLSGNNPNVMYELGFGHALEKPTVIINQEVKESPFDVKDFRQIVYQRTRLVKDCRPSLLSALCDYFGAAGPAQTATNVSSSLESGSISDPNVGEPPGTLRPSTFLSAELQKFHLRLQVARSKNDIDRARDLARELRQLLSRITVVSGMESDHVQNCGAPAGNCAVELERMGLTEEAEHIYQKAIGIFPDYAGVHIQYADFLVDAGRIKEAEQEVARAYELDEDDARVGRVQTKIALRLGEPTPEVATKLRTEFEAEPANADKAIEYLMYLQGSNAPVAEFEIASNLWMEASPPEKKWQAERALADRLAVTGDPALHRRAVELYEGLLSKVSLDGNDRHATLHNVATLYAILGDRARARAHWVEAYGIKRDDPAVRAAFSQSLAKWGDLEVALVVSEGRALPQEP